jgi:hypothetical protein
MFRVAHFSVRECIEFLMGYFGASLRGDDQIPARRHSLAPVETYEIERQQFDHIEGTATSISVTLSAAFALIPLAVSLSVTLATVTIKDAPYTVSALWGLMTGCYVGGIVFGVLALTQRGQLKEYMENIRKSQVSPVAAKGAPPPTDLTSGPDPDASAAGAASQPDNEGDDAQ